MTIWLWRYATFLAVNQNYGKSLKNLTHQSLLYWLPRAILNQTKLIWNLKTSWWVNMLIFPRWYFSLMKIKRNTFIWWLLGPASPYVAISNEVTVMAGLNFLKKPSRVKTNFPVICTVFDSNILITRISLEAYLVPSIVTHIL